MARVSPQMLSLIRRRTASTLASRLEARATLGPRLTSLPQRRSASHVEAWNAPSGYKYGTPPQNRTTESWEYIWYPYLGFLTIVFGLFYFVYPPTDPFHAVEAETIARMKERGTFPTYTPIHGDQIPKGLPNDPITNG